jgi:hypothetical protein
MSAAVSASRGESRVKAGAPISNPLSEVRERAIRPLKGEVLLPYNRVLIMR